MKHALLVAAFVLAASASAQAQVHPCDAPPQTAPTKGTVVGWCHDMRDDDGLTLSTVGFYLTITDPAVGPQTADLGPMAPKAGLNPNAAGLRYFEATLPGGYPRGLFDIYLTAYVPGENQQSVRSETVVWQRGGPPNKPEKPRIAVRRTSDGAQLYAVVVDDRDYTGGVAVGRAGEIDGPAPARRAVRRQ